ncbi:MAG TPA: TIM barrel protein [Fibrobacteria bacterium]|nr:TIM barrel protein [Fibrobacteria bacterium]
MKTPHLIRAALGVLVVFFGGSASAAAPDTLIRLRGDFVPFGMCMGGMSPQAQVDSAMKIGFRGLGLQDMNKSTFQKFQKVPAVASGEFKIHSAMWWTNVKDTAIDTVALDGMLDEAKKLGLTIWMVLDGSDKTNLSKSKAVSMIVKAARRCKAKGVKLALYPHGGCVISSAEEGLQIIDSLKKRGTTNVRLTIHLCHELKAGNRSRLPQVVAKVASYLDFATVSGADSNTYGKDDDNWASAIKPLDQGTFDATVFLKALAAVNYAGPIELHTYNLKSPAAADYDGHLERSLEWWKQRVTPPERGTSGIQIPLPSLAMERLPNGGVRLTGIPDGSRVRMYDLDGKEHPEIHPVAGVWEYTGAGSMAARVVRVQGGRAERSMVVF